MTASLTFGALDLMGDPGGSYSIEALGTDSGTTWGSPQPVEVQLRSFLQYGAVVVTQGWENRQVVVTVAVVASDTASLADAEAALFAEVGRPNRLTFTPHDGFGYPTEFRVITSRFEQNPDDLREVKSGERIYTIALTCEPFAYSATATTVPALAASGSTTVNVDNGSSTTGWTGSTNSGDPVTVSTTGGALKVATNSALSDPAVVVYATRTGSVSTSSTPYIVVDWKYGEAGATLTLGSLGLDADGVTATRITSVPSPTAGYTRTTFRVNASSVSTLTFGVSTSPPSGGSVVRSLTIDNIDRTDVSPAAALPRQQVRTIEVDGSAPTIGSIAVEHATSALGEVLLYTYPDDGTGYVPYCRPYHSAGSAVSSDANAVSGYSEEAGSVSFDIPTPSTPGGTYLVMARMKRSSSSTVTFDWSVTPRLNSTDLSSAETHTVSVALTTSYAFVRLGTTRLPMMDVASTPSSVTRLNIDATVSETLDELYLFNMDIGRLTGPVSCGTGTPAAGSHSNRLWIDSPSVDNDGLGRYLRGYASDRSDAFSAYPFMTSPGIHEFAAGGVKVLTVTTNPTTAADVSFTYHPAWHTHAAA